MLGAYAGPLVLFLLLGGVIADRLPRRAVMIGSDAVRGVLHAIVALLIALDAAQVWHLVVVGLLFGTAAAFFRPAYTGLVPQCVPEDLIQPAQGLSGISREVSIIAGPAIGTALVIVAGAAAAYALDVVTFAISIAFLLRVHPRERGEPGRRSTILVELREGWVAVRERAWVWATIAAFSVTLLCGVAPYFTLGASIAADGYGDVAVYGLMQILSRRRHGRRIGVGESLASALPAADGHVLDAAVAAGPGRLRARRAGRAPRRDGDGGRRRARPLRRVVGDRARAAHPAAPALARLAPTTGWARSPSCPWATSSRACSATPSAPRPRCSSAPASAPWRSLPACSRARPGC